jgi:pimeloyl-ACP methyl ester carboxylesterase
MRFVLPLLVSLLLIPPCTLAPAEGLARIISYVSSLDSSTQQYGLYLPAAPAPSPAGYPAVFHMHGYGWSVSAGFSGFQKRWAEDHGWILINVNARGPQFYDGVGDVETLNVVRDARDRFGLDMARLYVTGGSMGGTGAFRAALRHPELFAAAVGVDGWSDFREWHYHWYARTDQREAIEEFRRPLLEAASPLYWAGRARWNAIQASVSGQDNVVLPVNGILLSGALVQRAGEMPGAYENRLFLDYEAGHGGSTRMDQIYEYFLDREAHPNPPSFICESPVLAHGQLYWGSMLRQKVQGMGAALESYVEASSPPAPLPRPAASGEGRTAAATATVVTRNLSALAVHLQASPAAGKERVDLYVDGFLAYQGPARTVTLAADLSPRGDLWGWREQEPEGLRKTPQLEGPIGKAFEVPFIVAYGTSGPPAEVARHRREAEDFARGWDAFMVHAEAVRAIPEERVSAADLQAHALILFGTEHSSALLREANAVRELPVHVLADRVIVRDPQWGDREYLGGKFGAFFCAPNPLSGDRTYLVVCRGQWATQPDGSARQGLEYDLEKLPWAYPDYVVFNSDQSELPHVLNVNNKPPVTCYEAGYFVEAGYFDQDWQPYRLVTLDRVRAQKPATRLIHVERVRATAGGVQVAISDEGGGPVAQARVTVRADGVVPAVYSGVTDGGGSVTFAQIASDAPATVVNVMATGAEYDWQADRQRSTEQRGVGLVARAGAPTEAGNCAVNIEVSSDTAQRLTVSLQTPVGEASPPREIVLGPGGRARAAFDWDLAGVPAGTYQATAEVMAHQAEARLTRPVFVTVGQWQDSPLRLTELVLADIIAGGRWQATVRLRTIGAETQTATVRVALPADRIYPPPQTVTVEPGKEVSVVFAATPAARALDLGMHPVRAYVEGQRGVTAYGEFTVK